MTTSLVLALVGATGLWQYYRLSDEYVDLMREQQQALTQVVAADLDYKLGMHLAVLARAAHQATAQTFAEPEAQQRFFAQNSLVPMFDGAALVGLDGQVLVNDPPNPALLNIGDRDYFRRARDQGLPAISAPLLTRHQQRPAILMAVPAKSADGRVVGIVSAGLNLDRPNTLGNVANNTVGRGYYVIVTRGAAPVFVVHPDVKRLLQPATAPPQAEEGDTSHDLVTSASIRSMDWELRIVVPAEAAYAPLERARQALLLQMFWLALVCGALVWAGTTWLMRPLGLLYNAIRELRQSPDSPVNLDVRANDERGDLAREFDALMTELRDRRTEMAAVTDGSPVGLFRCDTEGRAIYVNDAYLAIQGLDRSEVPYGWLRLVPEAVRDKVRDDWKRIVKEAKPFNTTRLLHRLDGSEVLVALRMQPILVEGRFTGYVGTLTDITERTRAEQALRTLTAVFESTTDYVVQLDPKGRLTYMNPAARMRSGVALGAPIQHLTMLDFNPPETLARHHSDILPVALAKGVWVGESMVWDADRRVFPVSHMVIAHRDAEGQLAYFSALMRDISAAKATEQALKESEARLRTVADALPVRVAYLDAGEHYRFSNQAYERGMGLSHGEIEGRTARDVLGEAAYQAVAPHVRAALGGERVTFQSEVAGSDAYQCFETLLVPQRAADGASVIGFHAVVNDITRQKREERRLVQLARVDSLTGLGNRSGFEVRLAEAMNRSRTEHTLMALLYLDIDRFKQVNDKLGHQTGDALLKGFAGRLTQTMRSTDFVARLGGDEFTAIMEDLPRTEVAAMVAEKIVQAMRAAFVVDGKTVQVTTSIGLAFYGGGPSSAEAVIRRADEMLYQAKGAGRNNVQAATVAD